jgi:hypothetical protein
MTDSELYDLARERGFPGYVTRPSDFHVNGGSSSWNKVIARITASSADLDRQNAITDLKAMPPQAH